MGQEDGRSDHLDPVAADGIFGVVSEDPSSPEDCLFVQDLTEDLKGVVFVQLVLVQVVEQKLQSVHYFVAVELEIFGAVLQKMNEIFDNFIDLNVLYLIGNVFLQVGIALGRITTLFFI